MKHFLLAALLLPALGARANDGSLTWGNAPRLTQSHSSVEMKSEVVRLRVGRVATTVDCRFIFENHGPACTVRMGFPDHSDDEEMGHGGAPFSSFRSWVDGKPVPTKSVLGPLEEGTRVKWRTKIVRFGARGTSGAVRRVRDVYSVDTLGDPRQSVSVASYTLHTGSSWRGPIGKSEIIVSFPDWRGPFRAIPRLKTDSEADMKRLEESMKPKGTLGFKGPGTPRIEGKSLRWVRTRWRPTLGDDIQIFFRYL